MRKSELIDVDRIAQAAIAEEQPKPDLLKTGIPLRVGSFYIAVEPITPSQFSAGNHGARILTAAITQEAESYQITIGRVLQCGPTAFDGKTESGIELGHFLPDITCAEDLIGKYVIFRKHTGQKLTLRASGQDIRLMTLDEFLGVTDDPTAWRFWA